MIQSPPAVSHLACGPKLANGDQLCANKRQCDYWFKHDGKLYRAFFCDIAYPETKKKSK
jgi:hypothetical protein